MGMDNGASVFLTQLAHDKGFHPIEQYEQWYHIKVKDILAHKGGSGVLQKYKKYKKALAVAFPHVQFVSSKFGKTHVWKGDHSLLVSFFNKLAHNKNFHPVLEYEHWYSIQRIDIINLKGGARILQLYKNKRGAISAAYPHLPLEKSKFGLDGDSQKLTKVIQFLNKLAHNKNFHPTKEYSRWYKVTSADFEAYKGGSKLIQDHNGKRNMIVKAFPNISFNISKFVKHQLSWKGSARKIVPFFNRLAHNFGFHPILEYEKWYAVRVPDIESYQGGFRILKLYKSFKKAIVEAYPEVDFDMIIFGAPVSKEDKRLFLDSAAHDMGFNAILEPYRWNNIDLQDLTNYKDFFRIFAGYPKLSQAVKDVYGGAYSGISPHRQEKVMQLAVKALFGSDHVVITNARKEAGMSYRGEDNKLVYHEIDAWIPQLQLGFEYQDPYHFTNSWLANKPSDIILQKDVQKVEMMKKLNRTLIVVPCWWDQSIDSLAATIQIQRPDLLPSYDTRGSSPISAQPPPGFFKVDAIPGIDGMLMAACFYTNQDITNWWMGEKYDGIRSCWVPQKTSFYSRQARALPLQQIHPNMPRLPNSHFLDGELWFGRKNLSMGIQLANFSTQEANEKLKWEFFRFLVFDYAKTLGTPSALAGDDVAFENRYHLALSVVDASHPFMKIISRIRCESKNHMHAYTNTIINSKGEGVILRKPLSAYEYGKSSLLLKFKDMIDTEGVVVSIDGYQLLCKLPNEYVIKAVKQTGLPPIKIGDVVTINKIPSITHKKERHNHLYKIVGVRCDLKWEDVVNSSVG